MRILTVFSYLMFSAAGFGAASAQVASDEEPTERLVQAPDEGQSDGEEERQESRDPSDWEWEIRGNPDSYPEDWMYRNEEWPDEGREQPDEEAPPAPEPQGPQMGVAGSLSFNYFYATRLGMGRHRTRLGDMELDNLALSLWGNLDRLRLAAEYRFYDDFHALHHGLIGYALTDTIEVQAGLLPVPLGLLPNASHSWFRSLPFTMGYEEDYDLGVRGIFRFGDVDLQVAFFKNDEGSFFGDSLDSARYSFDIVETDPSEIVDNAIRQPWANRESNQGNLHVRYTYEQSERVWAEVGTSLQLGMLHNWERDEAGYQWAAAAHIEGFLHGFGLQLEALYYANHPANPEEIPDYFVVVGGWDQAYKAAAEGLFLLANLSYLIDLPYEPLRSLLIYNDYSYLGKPVTSLANSHLNVFGVQLDAHPIYVQLDIAGGLHHPWLSPEPHRALAEGEDEGEFETRYNLNVAYHF